MINAKIIADSTCENGKRITTFELEYPRFIHSEFMTHRMISKNSASSRAIPVATMIQQVIDNPAMPVYWGKNQAGMSAKEELYGLELITAKNVWLTARNQAITHVLKLSELGLHKQIANRILEPWTHMKVIATATEWDNFFHLRRHKDAQPEIRALANEMYLEYTQSRQKMLYEGDWHLPYISERDLTTFTLGDCIKLSASLCAQVSYRKADDSIEKAMMIYDRLVNSKPVHASPFEHQATPLANANEISGNLRGWGQYRQQILGNVCNKYTPNENS
jgi:hypothetical protein